MFLFMGLESRVSMSEFEYGFRRAIAEIVSGFVISLVLSSFVRIGLIPPSFMLPIHVSNFISTVLLVFAFPFWATSYSVGWLVGLCVMYKSGLVEVYELLVYFVPLIIVAIRFVRKFTSSVAE
jgi:hypothetical protein